MAMGNTIFLYAFKCHDQHHPRRLVSIIWLTRSVSSGRYLPASHSPSHAQGRRHSSGEFVATLSTAWPLLWRWTFTTLAISHLPLE